MHPKYYHINIMYTHRASSYFTVKKIEYCITYIVLNTEYNYKITKEGRRISLYSVIMIDY